MSKQNIKMPVKTESNRSKRYSNDKDKMCCLVPCLCCKRRSKNAHPDHPTEDSLSLKQETRAYLADVPKDFGAGTCICIQGFIKPECARFSVDLKCDRNKNGDIAFHLNPRLMQRYVVRNCHLEGRWGEEETTSVVKFELNHNEKFDLQIFVTDKDFLVSINGRHICAFRFRVPLSRIMAMEILGPIEIINVQHKKMKTYPDPSSQNAPFIVPQGETRLQEEAIPVQQLKLPLTGLLPQGFQMGWQLEIYGRIKIKPHSFYINLQEGTQLWPHPVIPFHLNPRFNSVKGKHAFVRNAWIDGRWGNEECSAGYQLKPGMKFTLVIRCEENLFSVWVNGTLTGEFVFRKAPDQINAIYIQGDVVIYNIYMNCNVSDKFLSNLPKLRNGNEF